jgi:hypothetical protein
MFLRQRDARVLGEIGLTKVDQDALYNAWLRLRGRRQRTPRGEGISETK